MWNDLTMQQRADVISMAVKAGMRDMKSIRSFYDETLRSRRFEDGGDTKDTTPGMTGMMKAALATASHFGNPTARRMTNYDTRSYIWPNEYIEDGIFMEPKKGNVYVSSYDNLVTPQIQDTGSGLSLVEDVWSPENEQRSYSQSLKFNNEEDARYFGEHYKEIAPMMHLYEDGGKKITIGDNGRATISGPTFFVNTDIDSAIDMAEKMGGVQNLLPEVTVTGYRPIELRTYYPGGGQYPLTGHSSLVIPISDKVRDKYGMNSMNSDTPSSLKLVVDKRGNAEDYNLVTNNCADATLGYLNTMFHKKESPLLFTTPGDVRDFALDKLGGKKVFRDGVETILIPRNSKNADLLSTRAIERFANEPDDHYRTTRYGYYFNKKAFGGYLFEDGGSIKKC